MRRAVLDPNVLISGLIAPGGSTAAILLRLRDGAFELIASPKLLDELRIVLRRDKFRPYVTLDEVDEFVGVIERTATVMPDPAPTGAPLSADPGDEYLVRLAGAAGVDALVSGDRHLLALRQRLPVRSPREFLESIG